VEDKSSLCFGATVTLCILRGRSLFFSVVQRRYSVAKIDVPQAYEQGRPKLNGLSDPRLGTMDRAIKCTTDGASQQDSPGYFGHIELAKPVFHIGFMPTIMKLLRCISFHSSKILVDKVRSKTRKLLCTLQRLFVFA
jgi:DNA-directed RNA polymerase beta' subunit